MFRILLQAFSFTIENEYYSLALLSLRSALLAHEALRDQVEVRLLDSDVFCDLGAIEKQISDFEPHLLGLSVAVWNTDLSRRLARHGALISPRPVIVCGGKALATVEQEFLDENPAVDVVVHKDGEQTLVELVSHFLRHSRESRDLGDIDGLSYRDVDGSTQRTADRRHTTSLAELPSFHLDHEFTPPGRLFQTETARFCPFKCTYCSWIHTSDNSATNAYPLEQLKEELEWALEKGCNKLFLFDAAINYDLPRFDGILDVIDGLDCGADVWFQFYLKHELLDAYQIERLQKVNKTSLCFLGVESLQPQVIRGLNRQPKVEELVSAVFALAKNPRLRIVIGLMIGLPGERLESLRGGLEVFGKLNNVSFNVAPLIVAPGTQLRANAGLYGFEFSENGTPYLTGSNELPTKELGKLYEQVNSLALAHPGRIHFGAVRAPVSRIRNLDAFPDKIRRQLDPASWIEVGLVGLENGEVEACGLYRRHRLLE